MSFFRVPKEEERAKKWVIKSRRADLLNKPLEYLNRNVCFCHDHFEELMFSNPEKTRLNWNAVPTLFAVPNPPKSKVCKRHLAVRQISQVPPNWKLMKTINYVMKQKAMQQRRDQFQLIKHTSKYLQLRKMLKSKKNAIQYLQK